MRNRFDEQLTALNNSLIEMGALIEDAISKAVRALSNQDTELAGSIIKGDKQINGKERDIERLCLKLLLEQQPVARDLRQISTALKMVTDMERIGDHAADISELVAEMRQSPNSRNYTEKLEHIPEMAAATVQMVKTSIDAFVKKDSALAAAVIGKDDVVDELYRTVKKDMIQLVHEDPANGEEAFNLMQIAKYLERIGDHAVNIAEWVIFSITGKHKDKRIL
jgi:phosphate transport system protein